MEPLSPNDPLHTLLGKARSVEPRPNFTQNVVRAVRQVPQTQSGWSRIQEWLAGFTPPRMAYAATAVALVALVAAVYVQSPPWTGGVTVVQAPANQAKTPIPVQEATGTTAEDPLDSAVASELDSVDALSVLLAQQDTSALTDSEIALLLY